MIEKNIYNIIEKLTSKTLLNDAIWNKSSGVRGYKLSLKLGIITIDKWYAEDAELWVIDFNIINERGENIEHLQFYENQNEDFIYLNNFYSTIHRKYLKVDETIQSIIKEIDNENKIGRDAEESSDLPF